MPKCWILPPGVLAVLLLLVSPAAAEPTDQTIRVPVRLLKSNSNGTKFSTFQSSKPFLVTVRLYSNASGVPRLDANGLPWEETITIVPSTAVPGDPGIGLQHDPVKTKDIFYILMGATLPLPDDLLVSSTWFSTQVSTLQKGVVQKVYTESPLQPLGLDGLAYGQSIDVGSLAIDGTRAAESEPLDAETQMRAGLDALSTGNDLQAAAAAFRNVLEQDPTHYGATYQLAKALDQLQKPAEAEPLWQEVLVMANGYQDTTTADAARARLAESQTAETRMKAGLDAFYARDDPTAAAAMFRAVLEQNPTHYGAIYQLAAALDAAGNRDEARAFWEKMLPMAEAVNDQATIDTARARLADTP